MASAFKYRESSIFLSNTHTCPEGLVVPDVAEECVLDGFTVVRLDERLVAVVVFLPSVVMVASFDVLPVVLFVVVEASVAEVSVVLSEEPLLAVVVVLAVVLVGLPSVSLPVVVDDAPPSGALFWQPAQTSNAITKSTAKTVLNVWIMIAKLPSQ